MTVANDNALAHATRAALVATHCAACARELTDTLSAQLGIGPICRGRLSFEAPDGTTDWETALVRLDAIQLEGWEPTPRVARAMVERDAVAVCRALVLAIALAPTAEETTGLAVGVLRAVGFVALADRITARLPDALQGRLFGVVRRRDGRVVAYRPATVRALSPRVARINVVATAGGLEVECDALSDEQFRALLAAARPLRTPGTRYVPAAARGALWAALEAQPALRGVAVRGPRGERVLGAPTRRVFAATG
jgi:Family of unknown function (DUF6011)